MLFGKGLINVDCDVKTSTCGGLKAKDKKKKSIDISRATKLKVYFHPFTGHERP